MRPVSFKSFVCLSILLGFSLNTFAEDIQIPDTFESTPVDNDNATAFAKKCIPPMSDATVKQVLSTNKNQLATTSHRNVSAYLAVAAGQEFCVSLSEKKYPILPLSAFEDTITFNDMPKDQSRLLWTDIAKQISKTGFGTALVINETGNANLISYLVASEAPTKLYYQKAFLKKDEYTESLYPITYRASGTVSVVSRGAGENVKPIFNSPKLHMGLFSN